MSVKKIVVPEGMREVFHKAENHDGYKWDDAVLDHMLEAALRWLDGELEKMIPKKTSDLRYYRSPSMADTYQDNGYKLAITAVRRMFLAVGAFDPSLGGVLSGRTFTREQLDAIKEYLEGAVHG